MPSAEEKKKAKEKAEEKEKEDAKRWLARIGKKIEEENQRPEEEVWAEIDRRAIDAGL